MSQMNAGPAGTLDLDDLFSYHPPADEHEVARYQRIREAGRVFATVLAAEVPASPERSLAVSRVREAVMWANAGCAIHGPRTSADAPARQSPTPDVHASGGSIVREPRTPGPGTP